MNETLGLLVFYTVISLVVVLGIYVVTRLISAAYYRSKYEVLYSLLIKKGYFHG